MPAAGSESNGLLPPGSILRLTAAGYYPPELAAGLPWSEGQFAPDPASMPWGQGAQPPQANPAGQLGPHHHGLHRRVRRHPGSGQRADCGGSSHPRGHFPADGFTVKRHHSAARAATVLPGQAPVEDRSSWSFEDNASTNPSVATAPAVAAPAVAAPAAAAPAAAARGDVAPPEVPGGDSKALPANGNSVNGLTNSLGRLTEIMHHASNMAAFSGQHCVQAVALMRMAQAQLQVLIAQCQQVTLELSQGYVAEAIQQMQEQLQTMQVQYAQMAQSMTTPWPWVPPAAEQSGFSAWNNTYGCNMPTMPGFEAMLAAQAEFARTLQPSSGMTSTPGTAAASAANPTATTVPVGSTALAAAMASAMGDPAVAGVPESTQVQRQSQPGLSKGLMGPAGPGEQMPRQPGNTPAAASIASDAPSSEWMGKSQTLGMHLTQLQDEDPSCVFIVRKINSMGFHSQQNLAAHYSAYGEVLRVLVVTSKVKPSRNVNTQPRVRPGSLGFIVMATRESASAILSEGKDQTVAGCNICVEPFEQTAKPQESANPQENTASTCSNQNSTADTMCSGSRSGSNGSEPGSSSNGSDESGKSSSKMGHPASFNSKNDRGEENSNSGEPDSTDSLLAEVDSCEFGSGAGG